MQRGFVVLSLFTDTFDAENATAACDLPEAQGILNQLYEKSLLTRSEDAQGQSRYTMLRPTRAYATQRLEALPDLDALRAHYVAHYGQLVVDNDDINHLHKLATLDEEWQNALAAADYAETSGDAPSLYRLSEYLGDYLLLRGRWSEQERLNRRALEAARRTRDRQAEGRALMGLGAVYQRQGRWEEAIESYEQSLVIERELGDRIGEGKTLENLALLYRAQGDIPKALEWERQALQVLQTTEDRRAIEKAQGLIAEWEGKKA